MALAKLVLSEDNGPAHLSEHPCFLTFLTAYCGVFSHQLTCLQCSLQNEGLIASLKGAFPIVFRVRNMIR